MAHKQLRMRCDLSGTGANAHRVTSLYAQVINCIQLYLMNDGFDDQFLVGVNNLHKLNKMIGTNAKFIDLVKSYAPQFYQQWSDLEALKMNSRWKAC